MTKSCLTAIVFLFFFIPGTLVTSKDLTYWSFAPDFWEASKKDNVFHLKKFLKKNPSLLYSKFNLNYNWTYKDINLIHLVAHLKNPKMLKYVINKGSDVNSKDKYGWTPLYFTFVKKHAGSYFSNNVDDIRSCIKILLKGGADINVKDNFERTPLAVFIQKVYRMPWRDTTSTELSFVKWMIRKAKADPRLKDKQDNNLLHLAARKNFPFLAKLLIDNEVEINALNAKKLTPLDYAKSRSQIKKILKNLGAKHSIDIINSIIKTIDNNEVNQFKVLISQYPAFFHSRYNDNLTILHKAVLKNKPDIVKEIIKLDNRKSLLDTTDKNGKTAFFISIERGNINIAKILHQSGADIHKAENNGLTPLHQSILINNLPLVSFLLLNEAQVDKRDKKGRTPLFIAAENGFEKLSAILLYMGAKPNPYSEGSYTPLHAAAANGNTDLVELLIKAGADVNVKTSKNLLGSGGYTPYDKAVQHNHLFTARRIKELGGSIGNPISPDTLGKLYGIAIVAGVFHLGKKAINKAGDYLDDIPVSQDFSEGDSKADSLSEKMEKSENRRSGTESTSSTATKTKAKRWVYGTVRFKSGHIAGNFCDIVVWSKGFMITYSSSGCTNSRGEYRIDVEGEFVTEIHFKGRKVWSKSQGGLKETFNGVRIDLIVE